jgi:RNA polymerase sigma-70 factor (ECF subfamily)
LKSTAEISGWSDEELVKEIVKTRDSVLFAELYDRFAAIVYNKCLGFAKSKEEAEDLTHDIFIKMFVKLNTYQGKSKFSTWLYSFTYNYCVNYLQRNSYKKNETVSDNVDSDEPVNEITDEDILQLKAKRLKKALELIDPNDKMILLLKYQDDLSIKEIQSALEIGESAVKMRLKRAKEKVMEAYNKI